MIEGSLQGLIGWWCAGVLWFRWQIGRRHTRYMYTNRQGKMEKQEKLTLEVPEFFKNPPKKWKRKKYIFNTACIFFPLLTDIFLSWPAVKAFSDSWLWFSSQGSLANYSYPEANWYRKESLVKKRRKKTLLRSLLCVKRVCVWVWKNIFVHLWLGVCLHVSLWLRMVCEI